MTLTVNAIVAHGNNDIIGVDNTIPWKVQQDMDFFKGMTEGSVVIMGRNTKDSLPKFPLKNRKNIVITRNPQEPYEVSSIEEALKLAEIHYKEFPPEKDAVVWVIGGLQIYEMFKDIIDKWYVNEIQFNEDIKPDGEVIHFNYDLLDGFTSYGCMSYMFKSDPIVSTIRFTNYVRKQE